MELQNNQPIEYHDRERRISLRLCRLYYSFQYFLVKVPRYSREYYVKNISTLPKEKNLNKEKQYLLNWTPFKRISYTSWLLVAYYVLFSLKYIHLIFYTLASTNFKRPESNIITKVRGDQIEHDFGCIKTNCTRFTTENKLAYDLIQFPIVPICWPNLGHYYIPFVIGCHQVGLMIGALFVFYLFVSAILEPPFAMKYFVPIRICAFLTCPNVVRGLELKRTQRCCFELAESHGNYLKWLSIMSLPQKCRKLAFLADSSGGTDNEDHPAALVDHLDCLPINVSHWWHGRLISVSPKATIVINIIISLGTLGFHLWTQKVWSKYHSSHTYLLETTNRHGCSIWTTGVGSSSKELTEIPGAHFGWFSGCEYACAWLTSIALMSIAVNAVFQAVNEVQLTMNELHFHLEMAAYLGALRISQQDSYYLVVGETTTTTTLTTTGSSMFSAIRQKLMDNSRFVTGLLITRQLEGKLAAGTQLDHRLACQQFALDLLAQFGHSVEPYADLLDKILISYWNFARLIGDYQKPLSALMLFCYAINFGFSFVSLYLSRKFPAFQWESLFLNISMVVALNAFIATASIVHSQAKRIELKLWTLVALNCQESNERIRHNNHLARKQLQLNDANGGLAMKAFGLNMTYVRIIEVSFWTTSIILLAYIRY